MTRHDTQSVPTAAQSGILSKRRVDESPSQELPLISVLREQLTATRRVLTQAAGSTLSRLSKAAEKCRALGDEPSRSNIEGVVKS
ncbi:MAG: hypothetical protein Q9226_007792, partial [Calogaya cf. arnoldii]